MNTKILMLTLLTASTTACFNFYNEIAIQKSAGLTDDANFCALLSIVFGFVAVFSVLGSIKLLKN